MRKEGRIDGSAKSRVSGPEETTEEKKERKKETVGERVISTMKAKNSSAPKYKLL